MKWGENSWRLRNTGNSQIRRANSPRWNYKESEAKQLVKPRVEFPVTESDKASLIVRPECKEKVSKSGTTGFIPGNYFREDIRTTIVEDAKEGKTFISTLGHSSKSQQRNIRVLRSQSHIMCRLHKSLTYICAWISYNIDRAIKYTKQFGNNKI